MSLELGFNGKIRSFFKGWIGGEEVEIRNVNNFFKKFMEYRMEVVKGFEDFRDIFKIEKF